MGPFFFEVLAVVIGAAEFGRSLKGWEAPGNETTRRSERTTTLVTSASTRSDSSPTTLKTSPSCPRKNSNTDVWQCSPLLVSWRKNSSMERRSLSTSESPPTHSTLPPFPSNSKHNACVYY